MISATYSQRGFSLIELIIVIVILGILAAVAAPNLGGFLTGSKENATRSEMMTLKSAIVGDASARVGSIVIDQGYKGDLGYRPVQLADLLEQPDADADWSRYTQIGWNGPYLSDDGNESYLNDAWGKPYDLTDTEIKSGGPNGVIGTGDDDITLIY